MSGVFWRRFLAPSDRLPSQRSRAIISIIKVNENIGLQEFIDFNLQAGGIRIITPEPISHED